MVKKREAKTGDDIVNLAQDDQACSGKLLRVLRVLRQVDCEPRVISAQQEQQAY